MTQTANSPGSGAWEAFEREAMPHADGLFRFAVWLVRDRGEAEDLVQETMSQALTSFHRYTPGTNCRAWLVRILQNVRNSRWRAKSREPVVHDPDDRFALALPFVASVPENLTDEDLLSALRKLPEHYQEVILLSDVQDLTYKEIASSLDIPIGTVMSRLHRGRALLRSELGGYRAAFGPQRATGGDA